MERAYSSCRDCGNPFHTRDNCPKFRKKFEKARRRVYELDVYYDEVEDYYPTWEDYCQDNADHYAEPYRSYQEEDKDSCHEYSEPLYQGNHESNINHYYEQSYYYKNYDSDYDSFSGYREECDDYYHEYFEPTYEEPQDSTCSIRVILNMIKEMEKKYESTNKTLESVVKQLGQLAEDVAQLRREQDESACGIVVDVEVDEEVIYLPGQENGHTILMEDKPLKRFVIDEIHVHSDPRSVSITPTNKVEEEGSRIKIMNVGIKDLGQDIKKWLRISFSSCMPISGKLLWTRTVKYRAFIGNSVGKCSLRPP